MKLEVIVHAVDALNPVRCWRLTGLNAVVVLYIDLESSSTLREARCYRNICLGMCYASLSKPLQDTCS